VKASAPSRDALLHRALALLGRDGLLLVSDRTLPSLVSLVTGGPVRGSWWGHPQGSTIFALANTLEGHADVLLIKLIAAKDTFVHRSLWPALRAVAQVREPCQLHNLSEAGSILLQLVDAHGELRADELPLIHGATPTRTADAARELERRLLARVGQVHTETGAHARVIESWDRWAKRVGIGATALTPADAERQVERAARAYAARADGPATARLPWQPSDRSPPRRQRA